jgi:hypothetical protein
MSSSWSIVNRLIARTVLPALLLDAQRLSPTKPNYHFANASNDEKS